MKEMVGGCCVCSDERGWDENPLVYCDGPACNVAVHSACYGIVAVPSGPWFCRKCESSERSGRVRCELCPSKDGAFKKTDNGNWAHVVCALYIPEVRFENVTTMEPILVSLIPQDRYNKTCYICEERGEKNDVRAMMGACMQCNKPGCKQYFHVTCAQMMGLLCEEQGNMVDNVKYCGYCEYHYSKLVSEENEIEKNYVHRFEALEEPENRCPPGGPKLNENGLWLNFQKRTPNLKIIPPFKPIPSGNVFESPNSSPEKNGRPNSSGTTDGATVPPTVLAMPLSTLQSSDNIQKPTVSTKGSSKKSGSGKASSVSSSSSNGSTNNSNNNNTTAMPRIQIQPSNLFTSSGGFSSYASSVSVNSSSSNRHKSRSKSRSPSSEEIVPLPTATITSERKASSSGGVVGKARAYSTPGKFTEEEHNLKEIQSSDQHRGNAKASIPEKPITPTPVPSPTPPLVPSVFSTKAKDMATVSMKEVITSTVEKQMNVGTKFDRSGSVSFETVRSNNSNRIDKPPPDIVPHVTLTPIPMKSIEEPKNDLDVLQRRASKSPGYQAVSRTVEPMETEMATISLEKATPSPGKRMRLSLHPAPPLHEFDSDTESATEEWPDETNRSQSNSQSATPQKEHVSRRSSQDHQQQSSPKRMLTSVQAAEMAQWESSKSPTVSLERLPAKQSTQPSVLVSGPGLKESQGQPVQFSLNAPYPIENFPPRKRGPGRPSLNKGLPGGTSRDDEVRSKGPGGKRGRRGNSVTNYVRRDSGIANGNGALDDNVEKMDEDVGQVQVDQRQPPPPVSNGSGRNGRNTAPSSRKSSAAPSVQNSPSLSRKPSYDDAPGMTMSQLKAQMSSVASPENPNPASLAPHMFGNALNPASSMAQRMVDTLSQEMETITTGVGEKEQEAITATPTNSLVGVPFPGKSYGNTGKVNGVAMNGVGGLNGVSPSSTVTKPQPQTLEELLERQWEQGSQFLMEQAQHLDISQLLSCLNQLKADNKALEDHVGSLCQRKEQLTAINARLSIPLGSTNALGLGLGFSTSTSTRQETTPASTVGIQGNKTQAPLTGHGQSPQDVAHQGRYMGHRYSLESGTHAYQSPQPPQQHHRGSTGSIVTTSQQQQQQQQLYGYASQSGTSTSAAQPHLPRHQTPRDNR